MLVDKIELLRDANGVVQLDPRNEPKLRRAPGSKEAIVQFLTGGPVPRVRPSTGKPTPPLLVGEQRSFPYSFELPAASGAQRVGCGCCSAPCRRTSCARWPKRRPRRRPQARPVSSETWKSTKWPGWKPRSHAGIEPTSRNGTCWTQSSLEDQKGESCVGRQRNDERHRYGAVSSRGRNHEFGVSLLTADLPAVKVWL